MAIVWDLGALLALSVFSCQVPGHVHIYGMVPLSINNQLVLRMILLMMVAVCLNACILVEQPFSSFFEFYPRFRDFIRMLQHHGGQGAVP